MNNSSQEIFDWNFEVSWNTIYASLDKRFFMYTKECTWKFYKCLNSYTSMLMLMRYSPLFTRILQRMSMKWVKKVDEPRFSFDVHIRILKVICCWSKKRFIGLKITRPTSLNNYLLKKMLEWSKINDNTTFCFRCISLF